MEAFHNTLSVHFSPALPLEWLIVLGIAAFLFWGYGVFKRRKATHFRAIAIALFLIALMQPSIMEEKRQPVQDVAVILVDRSPSQNFGNRSERTDRALQYLQGTLSGNPALDLRIIQAPDMFQDSIINETRLFQSLDVALADVPRRRRAGVFIISDGQIHDIPSLTGASQEAAQEYGPVHLLLSGSQNERDRQLRILEAPSYGIVGKTVTIKYKIEDTPNINDSSAYVTIRRQSEPSELLRVPVNTEQTIELKIDHAGQNVFEIETAPVDDEITLANNKVALMINGVRERLRVLLVSGQPHAGGRTWRDLLTSDPSVDLVHFTILREPEKLDATPQDELSLIAFPFRELFEVKLYEFDLIVFNRYKLNRILPDFYFRNIANYVKEGGAFLEASGPSFAGQDSIYFTALMDILPGAPTGAILQQPFKPNLSDIGRQHPVTSALMWRGMSAGTTATPEWGDWLRQISIKQQSGETLMYGAGSEPLLILDRVENGRVAQLSSDHIWLWSRGYQQGGPHTELLRRIVHWLMKEPELDERALNISVSNTTISVRARDFQSREPSIAMSAPDGTSETITLERRPNGFLEAQINADQIGIYSFEDQFGEKRFAIVGELNPPELRGVVTTVDKMQPMLRASRGGAIWLEETPQPDIRLLSPGQSSYAGSNWLALRENREFTVQGVTQKDFVPDWLMLSLLLGAAVFAWWREGKVK
ncbi:MAG: hypothetical protein ACK4VI_01875 [Alphaproteobacteria bacterium]